MSSNRGRKKAPRVAPPQARTHTLSSKMIPILFVKPDTNVVSATFYVGTPEIGHDPITCPAFTGVEDVLNPDMFRALCLVRYSSDVFVDVEHPFYALHVIYNAQECLILHPHLFCAMFLVLDQPNRITREMKDFIESACDSAGGVGYGHSTYVQCLRTYKYTHHDNVREFLALKSVIQVD